MHCLFDLPHKEAVRLVGTGAPVYLPVNPVEYHGPHLSLHNDHLISLGLIRDLHARLAAHHPDWPLLVASDLEVAVEPCPGRGTRHHVYAVERELVREGCRALAELGARRVVLMTFHGAPLHNLALEEGVGLLVEAGVQAFSPFNLVLRELLMMDDPNAWAPAVAHIAEPAEQAAVLSELRCDFHAGFFETSMSLHYAPTSVSEAHRELPDCPPPTPDPTFLLAAKAARAMGRDLLARELDFAALGKGWNAMRPFYGYTGRPRHASARAGAYFAERIVDLYAAHAEEVFAGRAASPPPILPWSGPLSLHGRLSNLEIPLDQIIDHRV